LGQLDGFQSRVHLSGISNAIQMFGRVTDGYLDTTVSVGEFRYQKEIRLEPGTLVSGEFSPLAVMPGLRVGQSWTIRSFSPLRPPNSPMEPMQAVVVGEEWLDWHGRGMNTLVVEYRADSGTGFTSNGPPRGKMWVLKDGRIIQQEIMVLTSQMRFVRLKEAESLVFAKRMEEDEKPYLPLPAANDEQPEDELP